MAPCCPAPQPPPNKEGLLSSCTTKSQNREAGIGENLKWEPAKTQVEFSIWGMIADQKKPHLKQKVVNDSVFTEAFACTFSLAAFRYFELSLEYFFIIKAFNYIWRGFLKPRYIL